MRNGILSRLCTLKDLRICWGKRRRTGRNGSRTIPGKRLKKEGNWKQKLISRARTRREKWNAVQQYGNKGKQVKIACRRGKRGYINEVATNAISKGTSLPKLINNLNFRRNTLKRCLIVPPPLIQPVLHTWRVSPDKDRKHTWVEIRSSIKFSQDWINGL